jgi:hypothetical protein
LKPSRQSEKETTKSQGAEFKRQQQRSDKEEKKPEQKY